MNMSMGSQHIALHPEFLLAGHHVPCLASLPAKSDMKLSSLGGTAASVSGLGCLFSIAVPPL